MISFNPKARFLEMKDIASAHRDLVVRTSFTIALELALLDYQRYMFQAKSADPIVSDAQAQRLIGATEFIDKLLNLAELPEPPKPRQDNSGLREPK